MTTKTTKTITTIMAISLAITAAAIVMLQESEAQLQARGADVFVMERSTPPNIGFEPLSVEDQTKIDEKRRVLTDFISNKLAAAETREAKESIMMQYPIHYIGTDREEKALRIGIDEDYVKHVEEAEITKTIRTIVGYDVNIVYESASPIAPTCSQTGDCEPIQGGVQIMVGGVFGDPCSSGFQATYQGYEGFVTAGHCGEENDDVGNPSGWSWDELGLLFENSYYTGSECDCAFVKSDESVSDRIYFNIDPTGTATVDVDDTVYMEGYQTKGVSGPVIDDSISTFYDGKTFNDQVQADYDSIGGDSGGAVYTTSSGTKLVGITVAEDTNNLYSYFSKEANVRAELSGLTWNFN